MKRFPPEREKIRSFSSGFLYFYGFYSDTIAQFLHQVKQNPAKFAFFLESTLSKWLTLMYNSDIDATTRRIFPDD